MAMTNSADAASRDPAPAPTPAPAVQPPWLLARFAQGAIAVATVAGVVQGVVGQRDRHPGSTDASVSASGLASMVLVYAMTAAAVLFLIWFSRARRTALLLSTGSVAGSAGWAVLAWLIPVVNLWVPRQLLLEVRRASAAASGKADRRGLVNAWWAAWVARVVLAVLAVVSRAAWGPALAALSGVLFAAAGVLVICVIQDITALQGAAVRSDPAAGPLDRS
ncbi:DUF4328 domain-containing protein [Streptomyces sp. NPDC052040]|uniref:DUF4328 domain-containing protein n=1 Tax=unclassified Streptomyces TaxID=2593676 RepID=UPI0037D8137A